MTALDTPILTDVVCPDGCTEALVDDICGVELCSEHSNEFVSCAGSKVLLHHFACRDECEDCQAGAAYDDYEDRYEQTWRGED